MLIFGQFLNHLSGKEGPVGQFVPVFPNWFPFNNMMFDGHLRVGKYEGVKTRNWNWDYRGPVMFYTSGKSRIARQAVKAYGYQNSPDNHQIILGVGNLVEVRPLTDREARKMVSNFNNMSPARVRRLLLRFGKENPIPPTWVADYGWGVIAPMEIGLFFRDLKKFKTPVPFRWPTGPQKPIFVDVVKSPELSEQLKLAEYLR
jgi:hypothetical protein